MRALSIGTSTLSHASAKKLRASSVLGPWSSRARSTRVRAVGRRSAGGHRESKAKPVLFALRRNLYSCRLRCTFLPRAVPFSQLPQIVHENLALGLIGRLESVLALTRHEDKLAVLELVDLDDVAKVYALLPSDWALRACESRRRKLSSPCPCGPCMRPRAGAACSQAGMLARAGTNYTPHRL